VYATEAELYPSPLLELMLTEFLLVHRSRKCTHIDPNFMVLPTGSIMATRSLGSLSIHWPPIAP
jgi:hypothetical protein